MLRRALVKQKRTVVTEIAGEFRVAARLRGHDDAKITEVWELVTGFNGYAFNKAHSTAYGVEAYQAAWLKRYHPAEFMAGVLTHGKGFYHPLVYVLECHRLGLKFLPPSVNEPGPAFVPHGQLIRVPVTRVKGSTEKSATTDDLGDRVSGTPEPAVCPETVKTGSDTLPDQRGVSQNGDRVCGSHSFFKNLLERSRIDTVETLQNRRCFL